MIRFEGVLEYLVRWGRLDPEATEICREVFRRDGPAVGLERLLESCRLESEEAALVAEAFRGSPAGATLSPLAEGQEAIGGYRILGLLGEGGMGRVLLAVDESGRRVALKTVRREAVGDRFLQEGRLIARLDHPNVIRIHDGGVVDGVPYLAMEYVEGCGLDELVDREPVSPRRVAHLIAQAARGLEAAHEAGILHRDVKPSNLLVDGEDRLRVVDFGLATEEIGSAGTRTGHLLGSVHFMSPEQARGEWRIVDHRSDIYGLGGVLYHALTRRPPADGQTLAGIVAAILFEEVVPVRRRAGWIVPRDLEAITMKALERDPDRRYASSAAMADDLDRYLAGQPVAARPVRSWRRAVGLAWRHRRVLGPALLLVGLGLVALGGQLWRDGERRVRARELTTEGDRRMAAGDIAGAREAYVEAFRLDPSGRLAERVEVASTLERVEMEVDAGGALEVSRARALLASIGAPFEEARAAVAGFRASLDLAFLDIEIDIPGATVVLLGVSDRVLEPGRVVLGAGNHRLALDRPGRRRWILPIELAGRERLGLVFREHRVEPGDPLPGPDRLPAGSIVHLAGGRHDVEVQVHRVRCLLIEGEVAERSVVAGDGGLVLFECQSIEVRDLAVESAGVGLTLDTCRRVLLEGLEIEFGRRSGVLILERGSERPEETVLRRMTIRGPSTGIAVMGLHSEGGELRIEPIEEILVEDSRVEVTGIGLSIRGGQGVGVRRCSFPETEPGSIETPAVWIDRSSSVDVSEIEVVGRHTGLRVDRSRDVSVRASTIRGGGRGISFMNARRLRIAGVSFEALDDGIDGKSGYGVVLVDNRFVRIGQGFDLEAVVVEPSGRSGNVFDERTRSTFQQLPIDPDEWTRPGAADRPLARPAWEPGWWLEDRE